MLHYYTKIAINAVSKETEVGEQARLKLIPPLPFTSFIGSLEASSKLPLAYCAMKDLASEFAVTKVI